MAFILVAGGHVLASVPEATVRQEGGESPRIPFFVNEDPRDTIITGGEGNVIASRITISGEKRDEEEKMGGEEGQRICRSGGINGIREGREGENHSSEAAEGTKTNGDGDKLQ